VLTDGLSTAAAAPDDLERLTALRIAPMRPSLEHIDQFQEERARAWMARTFRPADTRLLLIGGELAGCIALYEVEPDVWRLEHFYIDPRHQGRGLGSTVLRNVLELADALGAAVRLTVVRESRAIGLYERHGFAVVGRDDIDVYFERPARRRSATAPAP
jgi:ribosomal protein S18 acetylase RimI-like enzyme